MQFNQPLLAAGLLLSLTTLTAEASLTSYTGAGGAGLVYSSVSNVTWTQDANLFKTLYDANHNLVNLITAVTPSYNDPAYGNQVIGDGGAFDDFNTSNGRLSWWGALAFTNYLNSINYAGSNQWRLPTVTDTGTAGCNFAYSGTDCGNNVDTSTGELATLYYDELNKTAYYNTAGAGPQPNFGILGTSTFSDTAGSAGPFSNVHTNVYWSGTEYAPVPHGAWHFSTNGGFQGDGNKDVQYYAWAVSPGQVSAVPVPGAVWLMGTGLLGLLGLKRRGHAG